MREIQTMYLRISHRTVCRYSKPVQLARLEYRVFPVISEDQEVLRHNVTIEPACPVSDSTDAWGNLFRKAEWAEPIESWTLTVDFHVNTLRTNPFDFPFAAAYVPPPTDTRCWPAEVLGYLRWDYDPWDNDSSVAEWAKAVSGEAKGAFQKVQKLMQAICDEFNFCKGFTDVKTPPGEILRLKMGVCQDFATLMVASARSLGLPARYVSGYIYEGPRSKRTGPAPAWHGWAEVYFPDIGWRGFDPLNGILACHTHVRTAQGRWYSDAAPTIGRFIGIGVEQTTETLIQVDRADAAGNSIE